MRWLGAAARALWDGVRASCVRVATFFAKCVHNATKRQWTLPLSAGLTVAVVMLSPVFAATLIAIVVNDPEAHPLMKLLLDIAAITAAVSLVSLVPLLALPIAGLPIADLLNRWMDRVSFYYEESNESDSSRAGHPEGQLGCAPVGAQRLR